MKGQDRKDRIESTRKKRLTGQEGIGRKDQTGMTG
jgi:hypothetical protein